MWARHAVVVVEGKADQLAVLRWGYHACWVGGGSPPADFLAWVPAARRIYVAGDGDAGGQALLQQLRRLAPDRCSPIQLPIGLDPCALGQRSDGATVFQQGLLAAPVPPRRGVSLRRP